jgi:hypothetical protein
MFTSGSYTTCLPFSLSIYLLFLHFLFFIIFIFSFSTLQASLFFFLSVIFSFLFFFSTVHLSILPLSSHSALSTSRTFLRLFVPVGLRPQLGPNPGVAAPGPALGVCHKCTGLGPSPAGAHTPYTGLPIYIQNQRTVCLLPRQSHARADQPRGDDAWTSSAAPPAAAFRLVCTLPPWSSNREEALEAPSDNLIVCLQSAHEHIESSGLLTPQFNIESSGLLTPQFNY